MAEPLTGDNCPVVGSILKPDMLGSWRRGSPCRETWPPAPNSRLERVAPAGNGDPGTGISAPVPADRKGRNVVRAPLFATKAYPRLESTTIDVGPCPWQLWRATLASVRRCLHRWCRRKLCQSLIRNVKIVPPSTGVAHGHGLGVCTGGKGRPPGTAVNAPVVLSTAKAEMSLWPRWRRTRISRLGQLRKGTCPWRWRAEDRERPGGHIDRIGRERIVPRHW